MMGPDHTTLSTQVEQLMAKEHGSGRIYAAL